VQIFAVRAIQREKGRSGNPAGKPRGTKSKNTQLIERLVTSDPTAIKDIIDVVVREAKAGQPWAVTEILKRLWVVPRSRLVKFPLPRLDTLADVTAAISAVLEAVAGGLLTIEEGAMLADTLEKHSAVLKNESIERRLRALEDDAARRT
jgi:hypothetical protein